MSDLLDGGLRVARKAHKCSWCSEEIKSGECYPFYTHVDSGQFYTTKLHSECRVAMEREDRLEGGFISDDGFDLYERWRGLTYYETDEMQHEMEERSAHELEVFEALGGK